MRTLPTIAGLRAALAGARASGATIGLVPTMGAFHDGHLSLMRRARARCDVVVVSLFVNPSQFNDPADLAGYPRDEARDAGLAEDVGVDLLFAPGPREIYPAGFATTVSVAGLTDVLEGAQRGPEHFRGVATVVTKLLTIVAPDVAYFGHKDAQQLAVIRRLVADLNLPVTIEPCAIVRDLDGLALSSRNVLLSERDRRRALALSRALDAAERTVLTGARRRGPILAVAQCVLREAGVSPDYLELAHPDTMAAVQTIEGGALLLVAAHFGAVRLIDNRLLAEQQPHTHLPESEVATPVRAPTSA